MQCKSCNAELPKHAKVCPRCGALVSDKSGNLKVIAVIGLVIAFIGGLLPFVQNTSDISDAYSFMNIDLPVMWYLFMIAIVVAILLLVARKDVLSIIPTAIMTVPWKCFPRSASEPCASGATTSVMFIAGSPPRNRFMTRGSTH